MSDSVLNISLQKLDKLGKLKDYEYDLEDNILLKYNGKEKNITLPDCFTKIAEDAFTGNKYVRKLIIADSYTIIGDRAFRGCCNLNSIDLGDNIITIGNSVFSECCLWELCLPDSISSVGKLAFHNNKPLWSIDIQGKDTWFEKDSFRGCENVGRLCKHRELMIGNIGLNMDDIDIEYK